VWSYTSPWNTSNQIPFFSGAFIRFVYPADTKERRGGNWEGSSPSLCSVKKILHWFSYCGIWRFSWYGGLFVLGRSGLISSHLVMKTLDNDESRVLTPEMY
jgi:hypothetical protein